MGQPAVSILMRALQAKPGSLCTIAGPKLFKLLASLPQQLSPSALGSITSLQLDVCPEQPQDWLVLQQLPGLRGLLLPGFKPAVPYQHLSALAQVTQLTAATLSVQVSSQTAHELLALVTLFRHDPRQQ